MRFYVGCSGWRNVPWRTAFYPPKIGRSDYLSYYSALFDFVEVKLTGTRAQGAHSAGFRPRPEAGNDGNGPYGHLRPMVERWIRQTPEGFYFSIHVPASVTGQPYGWRGSGDKDGDSLGVFLEQLRPAKDRLISLALDVPRHIGLGAGRPWLESILRTCEWEGLPLAVSFGNRSWFQDLTYNLLRKYNASIIWPHDSGMRNPSFVAVSNWLYFRAAAGPDTGSDFTGLVDAINRAGQDDGIEYAIVVVDDPRHAISIQKSLGTGGRLPAPSRAASFDSFLPDSAGGTDRHENSDRVIACVDLNAFYPSCEELRNPALKGKPHAVIMTDESEGAITQGVVSSCSYEARKFGVKSAMSLAKARAICPDLVLVPVDIEYYSRISEQVMSVLEPLGTVLEQASIDEAFLDCSARVEAGNPEALRQYGMRIKRTLSENCGLLCSIGIAPTKSAAKIASDYQKPDGLTVVAASELRAFLAPLAVGRVAGIGPKTEQALSQMGIFTLDQLARADLQQLKSRFGKNGEWMLRVANGSDDEPVAPRGGHVSVSTETTIESTRDSALILELLQGLAHEISERANRRGYSFRTVAVKLVRTDFSTETRETSQPWPCNGESAIRAAIVSLVARFSLADTEPAIRKVGLRLGNLSRKELIEPAGTGGQAMPVQKSLLDFS